MSVRNDDHRLRAGTYTSTGITSTYCIRDFPVQSDQTVDNQTAYPWAGPFQCLPPERARVVMTADGGQARDGFWRGILGPFSFWTFGMMSYVLSQIFPAGIDQALVSMMLYDATETAVYLNATLHRPIVGQDFEPEIGGWKNIRLRYEAGSITS